MNKYDCAGATGHRRQEHFPRVYVARVHASLCHLYVAQQSAPSIQAQHAEYLAAGARHRWPYPVPDGRGCRQAGLIGATRRKAPAELKRTDQLRGLFLREEVIRDQLRRVRVEERCDVVMRGHTEHEPK